MQVSEPTLEGFVAFCKLREPLLNNIDSESYIWQMYYDIALSILCPSKVDFEGLFSCSATATSNIYELVVYLVGLSLLLTFETNNEWVAEIQNNQNIGAFSGFVTSTSNHDISTSREVMKGISVMSDFFENMLLATPYGQQALIYIRMLRGFSSYVVGKTR